MITYEEFKNLYDAIPGEPEFSVFLDDGREREYMIIKCGGRATFQKCFDGGYPGGEVGYESLDELCRATQPDGVCLARDWELISRIAVDDAFYLDTPDDLEDCWRFIACSTMLS